MMLVDGFADESGERPLPEGRPCKARKLCVLVANDPRAYRGALAAALRVLRPNAEVFVAEPESLDLELERLSPDMVVCSHATPLVKNVPVWIDLYPGGERCAVVNIDGKRSMVDGLDLDGLLSIVDQAEPRGGVHGIDDAGRRDFFVL